MRSLPEEKRHDADMPPTSSDLGQFGGPFSFEPDWPKNLKRDGCHRGPLAGSGKVPGEGNDLKKFL